MTRYATFLHNIDGFYIRKPLRCGLTQAGHHGRPRSEIHTTENDKRKQIKKSLNMRIISIQSFIKLYVPSFRHITISF